MTNTTDPIDALAVTDEVTAAKSTPEPANLTAMKSELSARRTHLARIIEANTQVKAEAQGKINEARQELETVDRVLNSFKPRKRTATAASTPAPKVH